MQFSKRYIDTLHETLYYATHKTGLRIYVIPKKGFSKKYAVIGTKFVLYRESTKNKKIFN